MLPGLIAFSQDVLILMTIYLLNILVAKALRKYDKTGRIADYSFAVIFLISGALLALYPVLLREFLNYPVNIFEGDIDSASVLINEYLGLSAIITPLAVLLLGIVIALLKKDFQIPAKVAIVLTILLLIVTGLTIRQTSPHPFIYSVQNSAEMLLKNEVRAVPTLERKIKTKTSEIIELKPPIGELNKYENILLIVLEGVTAKDFENEFMKIPGGFWEKNKNNITYYKNYYTTNLDSYTSLISMLTGIQVPYRAYADESAYTGVNSANNLARDLKNRDFKNLFISTYQYQPYVPVKNSWNQIVDMSGLKEKGNWLTLGTNKMESATEDKAAIPFVMEYIQKNEKIFLLDELVYGHSPEWRARTGVTQLEYYDSFLTELKEKIKQAGELSKTLFVVVSDHGDRSKAFDSENYRVPLFLFYSENREKVNNDFLSHLDLPQLIYYHSGASKEPDARENIFIVGSTERWIYGEIKSGNEHTFILDSKGTVLSKFANISAAKIQKNFQEYVNSFNYLFGN